jgi:hypothetical protein
MCRALCLVQNSGENRSRRWYRSFAGYEDGITADIPLSGSEVRSLHIFDLMSTYVQ